MSVSMETKGDQPDHYKIKLIINISESAFLKYHMIMYDVKEKK